MESNNLDPSCLESAATSSESIVSHVTMQDGEKKRKTKNEDEAKNVGWKKENKKMKRESVDWTEGKSSQDETEKREDFKRDNVCSIISRDLFTVPFEDAQQIILDTALDPTTPSDPNVHSEPSTDSELRAESEQNPHLEHRSVLEGKVDSEGKPDTERRMDSEETDLEVVDGASSEPLTNSEHGTDSESRTDSEPTPNSEPGTDLEQEPNSESTLDTETRTDSEPSAGSKRNLKSDFPSSRFFRKSVFRPFRKIVRRIKDEMHRMRRSRNLEVKKMRSNTAPPTPPLVASPDAMVQFGDTLLLPPEFLTPCDPFEFPETLGPLENFQTLEPLENFQTLENLENFQTLEPHENFQTLENLENFQTLENLEDLENLENLENREKPKPLARASSSNISDGERRRRLLSEKRLAKRLVDLKMREVKVSDDGNCLFYAVAQQLEKDETRHSKIRENVANWLLDNSDYLIDGAIPLASIEEENGKTWNQFCSEMRNDRTFGTNACLYAISEIYGVEIFAVFSTEGSEFILQHRPAKIQRDGVVRLSFCDNNKHFNTLEFDPTLDNTPEVESDPPDIWHCDSCTRENYGDELVCFSCDAPKYRKPGGWKCSRCSVENDADAFECLTCKDCDLHT